MIIDLFDKVKMVDSILIKEVDIFHLNSKNIIYLKNTFNLMLSWLFFTATLHTFVILPALLLKFFLTFIFLVLDFTQLHKVISILHANSVPNLDIPTLLTSGTGSKLFVTQCEVAVDYLIKHRQFSAAQELTDIAGISREKITMSQVIYLLICLSTSQQFTHTWQV